MNREKTVRLYGHKREWRSLGRHDCEARLDHIMVPYHESRLYWVHDPAPSPPRRMEHTKTVPPSDSSALVTANPVSLIPVLTVFPFPVIL